VHAAELSGLTYRCLEGCGFCCTFTPEVAHDELSRLRGRFPELSVVREGERLHVAFQGGCGACTLLSRRRCTAYEDRPAHCRYFPFHVYFGRRTEVYVNRSCRGVAAAPEANLAAEFARQVTAVAPSFAVAEGQRLADKVHREFERRARAADAWGDVDREVARSLADTGLWARAAGAAPWDDALRPFAEPDVVARPYYLRPDLRWTTFEAVGPRTLRPLALAEDGSLAADGEPFEVAPPLLAKSAAAGLQAYLARLCRRDLFAGSVFDAVDGMFYEFTVPAAAGARVDEVASDLLVRASILQALGVGEAGLVDEVERFYDTTFLDAPTIGGWL
jgi:Fe-S-cluster containining protein